MSDNPNSETDVMQDKQRKPLFSKLGCIVILLLLAISFALFFSVVQAAREGARRMSCTPDMVRYALHNYHDRFGSFPPAYTTDAKGKPLHSWRTLVVLYSGYDISYDKLADIRLDEPWDSPHNSQFHDELKTFHGLFCVGRPEESAKGISHYQMIIGPDTISNGTNCTKLSDINKDKYEVILVVETSVGVPWMKPEDLPQSALKNGIVSSLPLRGKPVVPGVGSPHYTRNHVFGAKVKGAHAFVTLCETSIRRKK